MWWYVHKYHLIKFTYFSDSSDFKIWLFTDINFHGPFTNGSDFPENGVPARFEDIILTTLTAYNENPKSVFLIN